MRCAWEWSRRATCARLHVGAVLAQDDRIISSGYNGAPSGVDHCSHEAVECSACFGSGVECGLSECPEILGRGECPATAFHTDPCPQCDGRGEIWDNETCEVAVHAEMNAIAYAARSGSGTRGATLYVTHLPCLTCAKAVIGAGVKTVYFDQMYRDITGAELLGKAGVEVLHLPTVLAE